VEEKINNFMTPYFLELPIKSTVNYGLLKLCEQDDNWWPVSGTGTVEKKTPHRNLLAADSFLANHIIPRMPQIQWESCAHIFLMRPNTHYQLHTDGARSASINMLLNRALSNCYFRTTEVVNNQYGIAVLDYKPLTYYLFNNSEPHAITNRHQARYMLSITLAGQWQDHLDLASVAM
jgi:hypothetical protein